MIHSAFKGIVIAFTGHFDTHAAHQRRIDVHIQRHMLAGCAFKRRLEPRKLLVAERLRGKHLGRNNAMLFIVTGDILRLAGGISPNAPRSQSSFMKFSRYG